jgi:hypothetical protein
MPSVGEPAEVCVRGNKVCQRQQSLPIEWAIDEIRRARVTTSWCHHSLDLCDIGGRHQACLTGCQCPCHYHPALGCVQGAEQHTLALCDA